MRTFRGDLHVHTVLSPCADRGMLPRPIVARARARGLDLLGVCDHNSARNAATVARAAAGTDVTVVAGIEITTAEEVHLLGLFADPGAALAVSRRVGATLPPAPARGPAWMAPQAVVTRTGRTRAIEARMLAGASALSLREAVRLIHARGGLAVAAHADRPTFSVTSQLGFVPDDLELDALEVSPAGRRAGATERLAERGLPLVSSSDGHSLDEIGDGETVFEMAAPTLDELSLALAGREGRRCHLA